MSVQPRTPKAIRVSDFLQNLVVSRVDLSVASIQRGLFSYSEIVTKQDEFVDQLFVQEVLPEMAETLVS